MRGTVSQLMVKDLEDWDQVLGYPGAQEAVTLFFLKSDFRFGVGIAWAAARRALLGRGRGWPGWYSGREAARVVVGRRVRRAVRMVVVVVGDGILGEGLD